MDQVELEKEKQRVNSEVSQILSEIEKDIPGIVEGISTAVGGAVGGAISLTALSTLGTSGLSAVGISTGLTAMGGGMVAGIGVFALPIAALAVTGYGVSHYYLKKRKRALQLAALNEAIEKLHNIIKRLQANAEYFIDEIAELKATINFLKKKQSNL